MELRDAIENRTSVRSFAGGAVPVEDLKEMVRLAGLAPSANNQQPWRFIAITNRELLESMAAAVMQKLESMLPDCAEDACKKAKSQVEFFSTFFAKAPVVFAVAGCPYKAVIDDALPNGVSHDEMNAMRRHPDIQSIGASVENLLLAAVDMGYGGCWLSGPLVARDSLERILGLEEPWSLTAMVALGKPAAGSATKRPRKSIEEIFELRA
jgi:nitroreductase